MAVTFEGLQPDLFAPRPRRTRTKPQVPVVVAGVAGHDARPWFCGSVMPGDASVSGYVLPDPGGRPDELFVPRPLASVPMLSGNYGYSASEVGEG